MRIYPYQCQCEVVGRFIKELIARKTMHPKLLPFTHKHYGDFNYQFWPDLAGAHYSNEGKYTSSKRPQARPLENFLGHFGTWSLWGRRESRKLQYLALAHGRLRSKINTVIDYGPWSDIHFDQGKFQPRFDWYGSDFEIFHDRGKTRRVLTTECSQFR